jgi:hypothetical protein
MHAGNVVSVPRTLNAVKGSRETNNPAILGYIEGDNMWDYLERIPEGIFFEGSREEIREKDSELRTTDYGLRTPSEMALNAKNN